MQIVSFSPFGYEGALVSIEVDLRRGIPAVDIVGLADGAVKESRERMRCAIINSGLPFPQERILISLSPADLKKEGAGFDLAVALAVLHEKVVTDRSRTEEFGTEEHQAPEKILVMGELELNGSIRPVKAVHAAVSAAKSMGVRHCIVPEANASEAGAVTGMKVFGAENLSQAFSAMEDRELFALGARENEGRNQDGIPEGSVEIEGILFPPVEPGHEFAEVNGQEKLVRGLQIAAAGGHNLLAFGPPGCGKTLSLQKFPALLPLMEPDKAQCVTRIHSIAGLTGNGRSLTRTAPFRMPHQTASIEGMCGGGPHCTPGEISLAHNGVLFLDEAAEFRATVLQMLRVPLESGTITLSRAGRSTVYPANFQLLMSTNPCPCGNYGSREKICLCSSRSVEQYWRKFSGPLLDRIEIRVQVDGMKECPGTPSGTPTSELRRPIARAQKAQILRQRKLNAELTPMEIKEHCIMTREAEEFLAKETSRNGFSQRAFSGCMKLARTISDMKGEAETGLESMEEAVSFRKTSGPLM